MKKILAILISLLVLFPAVLASQLQCSAELDFRLKSAENNIITIENMGELDIQSILFNFYNENNDLIVSIDTSNLNEWDSNKCQEGITKYNIGRFNLGDCGVEIKSFPEKATKIDLISTIINRATNENFVCNNNIKEIELQKEEIQESKCISVNNIETPGRQTYKFEGNKYTISLTGSDGGNRVGFYIWINVPLLEIQAPPNKNWEETGLMGKGDTYTLTNGIKFILNDVSVDLDKTPAHTGSFCFNGEAGEKVTLTYDGIEEEEEQNQEEIQEQKQNQEEIQEQEESQQDQIKEEDTEEKECDGCLLNEKCINYGLVINGKYCSFDKNFVEQKEESSYCENNFECKSNICVDNKCISSSFIQKILNWFKKIFGV